MPRRFPVPKLPPEIGQEIPMQVFNQASNHKSNQVPSQVSNENPDSPFSRQYVSFPRLDEKYQVIRAGPRCRGISNNWSQILDSAN